VKAGLIKNHNVCGSGFDENNFYEIEVGLMAVIMDIHKTRNLTRLSR